MNSRYRTLSFCITLCFIGQTYAQTDEETTIFPLEKSRPPLLIAQATAPNPPLNVNNPSTPSTPSPSALPSAMQDPCRSASAHCGWPRSDQTELGIAALPAIKAPLTLDATLKANLIWNIDDEAPSNGRDRSKIREAKAEAAQLIQAFASLARTTQPESHTPTAAHQFIKTEYPAAKLEQARLNALLAWHKAERLEASWEARFHHSKNARDFADTRLQNIRAQEALTRAKLRLLSERNIPTLGEATQLPQLEGSLYRASEVAKQRDRDQQKATQARASTRREETRINFGLLQAAQSQNTQALLENQALRHELKREILRPALNILTQSPDAARLPSCGNLTQECIPEHIVPARTRDIKREMRAITPVRSQDTKSANARKLADQILNSEEIQGPPKFAYLPEIQVKRALLIGINNYADPDIPALESAQRDVKAIGNELTTKLGYVAETITDGSRAEIVDAMLKLAAKLTPSDSVILYFAGHGFLDEDTGKGYWIPADGRADTPEKWISNDDITRLLSLLPARQIILVSDSCYSGSLTREYKITETTASTATKQTLSKRSVIVMSSGGEEPVSDEGKDGFSIFAWSLQKSIQKLERLAPGSNLFEEIKSRVVELYPQTPQYGASTTAGHERGGDYFFEKRSYR